MRKSWIKFSCIKSASMLWIWQNCRDRFTSISYLLSPSPQLVYKSTVRLTTYSYKTCQLGRQSLESGVTRSPQRLQSSVWQVCMTSSSLQSLYTLPNRQEKGTKSAGLSNYKCISNYKYIQIATKIFGPNH